MLRHPSGLGLEDGVSGVGTNHWSVQFPDWFAPLSPLGAVRASDTVQQATDTGRRHSHVAPAGADREPLP